MPRRTTETAPAPDPAQDVAAGRRSDPADDAARGDTKSARTRRRLLDAAAAVLSRKGFAGTRLSDIAEQAHVQAPAIYYYYSSREDLIEEVVHTGAQAMYDHLVDALGALPEATTPAQRIEVAVEVHLRFELEVSDYTRAIVRNANQLPEPVSRRALAVITRYNDLWRQLVAELEAAGQLRPDVDAGVGRMFVLGALNWTAEWWDPSRGELETIIATAQSMVLHALRP